MAEGKKAAVTVEIAGEEYTIRADATPEYTRRCAEYLDRTIREITSQMSLVDNHKVAILAALSIVDQLFQAQAESEGLSEELEEAALELRSRIEEHLTAR